MATNFPKIITIARKKLSSLISSTFFKYGRTKGFKAIRTDYALKCLLVMDIMLQGCCLEFDGRLVRVKGNLARPLTVPEIALLSKIKQRTLERILYDLKDMGLIASQKQFRRFFNGCLQVAAVWRSFTRLFWEKLGLWGLFVESVKYASEHAHLKPKNILKKIGKKKRYTLTEEQQRRSRQNNLWFSTMMACEHRPRAETCPGGYQCEDVCAICHRFPH